MGDRSKGAMSSAFWALAIVAWVCTIVGAWHHNELAIVYGIMFAVTFAAAGAKTWGLPS